VELGNFLRGVLRIVTSSLQHTIDQQLELSLEEMIMYGRRGQAYMNGGGRNRAYRCLEALSPCRRSKRADCQHIAQLNTVAGRPLQRVVKMLVVKADM
jgi:hypothetical protein